MRRPRSRLGISDLSELKAAAAGPVSHRGGNQPLVDLLEPQV